MSISYVENGDSGLVARTLINQAIEGVNNSTLPYTGSAKITGSLEITGSTTSTNGFIGSLSGNVVGNITGDVTGNITGNVRGDVSGKLTGTASYATQALSSSYATTASYVVTAQTASYVLQAVSASYATTASYALNGGGGSTNTGSLLITASVSSNTITFTKGNGTTFPITVNTGSGGGGSSFPYTGSAIISGSLEVTGSIKFNNGSLSEGAILFYSGSTGITNQSDFLFDGAGKITGGVRGTIDLSGMGTSAGCKGLILPLVSPAEPVAGSTYFDAVTGALYIYDGSQWLNIRLNA